MKNFKICHIGCGGMSLRGHGPALAKYVSDYPAAELAGCCDINEKKAVSFKEMFGFDKAYTDWKTMLDEIKPDAVSLVVPVKYTAGMAVEIAELGYNLLTEKPPGMTEDECRKIISAVNKSGVKAAAAFNRRYMPLVKTFVALIKDVKIDHIKYEFLRTGRKDADFSTTSIHGIDTVKMLTGSDYQKINIEYQPLKSTPVGNIFLNGVMESGATVSIDFYPDAGLVAERVTVISAGETRFLKLPIWDCPDYPGEILHYHNGKLVESISGKSGDMFTSNGFYDEHKDFYESIRQGGSITHEINNSLQSVQIMEAVRDKKTSFKASDS